MISFRFNNEIQRLFVNILFSSYTVMHNGYLYAKGRKSNIKKKRQDVPYFSVSFVVAEKLGPIVKYSWIVDLFENVRCFLNHKYEMELS